MKYLELITGSNKAKDNLKVLGLMILILIIQGLLIYDLIKL